MQGRQVGGQPVAGSGGAPAVSPAPAAAAAAAAARGVNSARPQVGGEPVMSVMGGVGAVRTGETRMEALRSRPARSGPARSEHVPLRSGPVPLRSGSTPLTAPVQNGALRKAGPSGTQGCFTLQPRAPAPAAKGTPSATAAVAPVADPSGGAQPKVGLPENIRRVQKRIEQCLSQYMSVKEVVADLAQKDNIKPDLTLYVWEQLKHQNAEFFKNYELNLRLKGQVTAFNQLTSRQVYCTLSRYRFEHPQAAYAAIPGASIPNALGRVPYAPQAVYRPDMGYSFAVAPAAASRQRMAVIRTPIQPLSGGRGIRKAVVKEEAKTLRMSDGSRAKGTTATARRSLVPVIPSPTSPAAMASHYPSAIAASVPSKSGQGVASPSVPSPVSVRSPAIASPSLASPAIVSPSPSAHSPAVRSPAVMSPSVASPSVMSPAVMSPAVMSPAAMSPAVMSPAVRSPAVMSPALASPVDDEPIEEDLDTNQFLM